MSLWTFSLLFSMSRVQSTEAEHSARDCHWCWLLKPELLSTLPPTFCPCLLTAVWDSIIDHYPLLKLKVQLGAYMPSPHKSVVKAAVKYISK